MDNNITTEKVKKAIELYKGNIVAKRFFYRKISTEWLLSLRNLNIFETSLVEDITANEWPEGDYLVRCAREKPKEVYEIVKSLNFTLTKNAVIFEKTLEILTTLCSSLDITYMLDKTVSEKWYENTTRYHLLSYRVEDLVDALIKNTNFISLGKLLAATLNFGNPAGYLDKEKKRYLEPRAYLEKHSFSNILEKVSLLVVPNEDAFAQILQPLIGSLNQYLSIVASLKNYENKDTEEDYSFIWKPIIGLDNDRLYSLDENLVVAIRDLSGNNVQHFQRVTYQELSNKSFKIFKRLKLYLLATMDSSDIKICLKELLGNIVDKRVTTELLELLKAKFSLFTDTARNDILNKIDISFNDMKDPHTVAHKAYFLKEIEDYLDNYSKERFAEVLKSPYEYSPGFLTHGVRTGPNARYSAIQLKKFSPQEIKMLLKDDEIYYLKHQGNEELYSPRGFGRVWQTVIEETPNTYIDNLSIFDIESILPIYIYHLLQGIESAVSKGNGVNWFKILNYIENTLLKYKEGRVHKVVISDPFEIGDSEEVLFSVLHLLEKGLRGDRNIPVTYRKRVWRILILVDKIGVNLDKSFVEKDDSDYFTYSINSLYGVLLHCVNYYAIWVAKKKKTKELPEEFKSFIRIFIEQHSEYKTGRSVLGYFLPWIIMYAKDLYKDIKQYIFPIDNPEIRYITWEAYLVNNVYNEAYKELREIYELAIQEINDPLPKRHYWGDVKGKLVDHLSVAYMYDLDDKDKGTLFSKFVAKKHVEYIKHAIEFFGRAYVFPHTSSKLEIDKRMLARLEKLWQTFLSKKFAPSAYEPFGWWVKKDFYSNNDVLFENITDTLELSKGYLDPDFKVLEQLDSLAMEYPLQTIKVLKELVHSPKEEKIYYFRDTEVLSILSKVEKSKVTEAEHIAKKVRDVLVGFGFDQYRL